MRRYCTASYKYFRPAHPGTNGPIATRKRPYYRPLSSGIKDTPGYPNHPDMWITTRHFKPVRRRNLAGYGFGTIEDLPF